MTQAASLKIRLAVPGMPGAEIYNYYQLISLQSSLYVKALDRQDEGVYAKAWDACAISTLEQIGITHQCWGEIQQLVAQGKSLVEDPALTRQTSRCAARLLIVDQHLNEWLSVQRWARVLLTVERHLRRLGDRIALQHPFLQLRLHSMHSGYDARVSLLKQVYVQAMKEHESFEQSYALPVAIG